MAEIDSDPTEGNVSDQTGHTKDLLIWILAVEANSQMGMDLGKDEQQSSALGQDCRERIYFFMANTSQVFLLEEWLPPDFMHTGFPQGKPS